MGVVLWRRSWIRHLEGRAWRTAEKETGTVELVTHLIVVCRRDVLVRDV